MIRIYFDTPTFDRITKDQAAKFVDILSTIGGTMGLLTGFSIISGIEIIFFAVKMIFALMKKYKWSETIKCFITKDDTFLQLIASLVFNISFNFVKKDVLFLKCYYVIKAATYPHICHISRMKSTYFRNGKLLSLSWCLI